MVVPKWWYSFDKSLNVCFELRVMGEVGRAGGRAIIDSARKILDLSRIQLERITRSGCLETSKTAKLFEAFYKIALSFGAKMRVR